MRPKVLEENIDNFNAVTREAIERMAKMKGTNGEMPHLEEELSRWSTESKGFFDVVFTTQAKGQLPQVVQGLGQRLYPEKKKQFIHDNFNKRNRNESKFGTWKGFVVLNILKYNKLSHKPRDMSCGHFS